MNQDMFLGHTVAYWMDLNKRPRELAVEDLIEEIVKLRGKISFYESRISDMNCVAGKS